MAAGAIAKLWEIADMVRVLEDWEARQVAAAALTGAGSAGAAS